MRIVIWNNCKSMFALKLYYFLIVQYAVIFNSLLTVPVALHFQCFQHFDFMNMKSICFSKKLILINSHINKFYYNIKKTVLEKKSDILVIYPELNMSRYECDKSYSFYFRM